MRMAATASSVIIPAMVFLMVFQLQHEAVHSYTPVHYLVGDEDGWDPVITGVSWSNGKKFFAGDVLEFKYGSGIDVSIVDEEAYDNCAVNDKSIEFSTGDTNITLAYGPNFFICSRPNICQLGLKMAIDAAAPPPSV